MKWRKTHGLLCAVMVAPLLVRAADHVEFKVELDATWESQSRTNRHKMTATCVVGSNDWFISGNFSKNGQVSYWLVGTNEVEENIITSSMYRERAEDFVHEKILHDARKGGLVTSYPRAGEQFFRIHPAPLGKPVFDGSAGSVWLAFCSANYLNQTGRQIPLPIGHTWEGDEYLDKTVRLQDEAGLPKSVLLFTTNAMPVCKYEVLQTTNYLGRILPLQFRVMQGGQSGSSSCDLRGKVTSLRPGKMPDIPERARLKLQK